MNGQMAYGRRQMTTDSILSLQRSAFCADRREAL